MIASMRKKILLAFAAAFLLVGTIVALSYHITQRFVAASVAAVTTSHFILTLEQTQSAMRDAETGQRGFLVSGDASYLKPYYAARRDAASRQRELLSLSARDDSALVGTLAAIRRLTEAKFAELEETIRLYRTEGAEAARRVVLSGRGKALMDTLRTVAGGLERREQLSFERASRQQREWARNTLAIVTLLGALVLVLLGTVYLGVQRYLRERLRNERTLRAERAQLEVRVRERTAELKAESERAEEAAASAQRAAAESEMAAAAAAEALAERIAAEQAQHESEERYRTLVEQVKDYAIYRVDPSGRATSWNEGVKRVLGYDAEEFLGQDARQIFAAEDVTQGIPERELAAAARYGTANSDRWMLKKGGVHFFATGITNALHDGAGHLVGFTKVMRDQTDRKRAEEALRRSETRYRLVARVTREAIWDWDLTANLVEWNEGVHELFGYSPEEVAPTVAWRYDHVHPEERDRVVASVSAATQGNEQFWGDEYRFRRRDGTFATVSDRAIIERDATGQACRMIGTISDLTEQRRAQEHLAQAQRMEAVGRLAGGVAHDLNNMLTSIMGYSQFVARSLETTDPRREDLEQITKSAERSASLTRSLLAFARRDMVQPTKLDLNGSLREMERMIRSTLGEHIRYVTRLEPSPAIVFIDRSRAEQVVLNLILNARDAMPQGGRLTLETASVTLDSRYAARHPGTDISPGPYVMLTVSDTGHGMDPATLGHIFEPFFTTKPVGEGTGLGLSSVYGVVKQAGGFVWAYSEPGHGSAFKVYLPDGGGSRSPGEPPRIVADWRGTETVLVVEDEDVVRRLAGRVLSAGGYRVLEAANGKEALAMLDGHGSALDLVLTDAVMPEMSGAQLAERLAAIQPGVAVVFMSGFTGDEVIRRGLMKPGQPFLEKPFSPDHLLATVRGVLDRAAGGPRAF